MKGFAGILILIIILITIIILINSTHSQRNEDNIDLLIPKINNFVSIFKINAKNMSYDCNWNISQISTTNCLNNGLSQINSNLNKNTLITCETISLSKIDENNYEIKLSCSNKIPTPLQKETTFTFEKKILLTRPQNE